MEVLLFGGVIALVAAGAAGIVYLNRLQKAQRIAELGGLASRMGWTFDPAPETPAALEGLEPFKSGHSHRMGGRLTRVRGEDPAVAFDFYYTTGGGNNATHHRQTVVQLPLPGGVPPFSVRPEHFGHRIAGVFGMQDIDFPEYPVFSQRYLLRGADEPAIRRVFRQTVVEFIEAHHHLHVTSSGPDLFVWLEGLAPAAEIETRMEMAIELRRRLTPAAD
jgi:carbonic anhydrase